MGGMKRGEEKTCLFFFFFKQMIKLREGEDLPESHSLCWKCTSSLPFPRLCAFW